MTTPTPTPTPIPALSALLNEDMVKAALKNVIDPEIGMDIVSLGLVYRVEIAPDQKKIDVDMTLTTPACPAGPQILEQARVEVMNLKDVCKTLEEAKINLVWSPFWSPALMSEDAKAELGFF